MAQPNWSLRGEYMESCNCDYLCPCIYTNPQGPATHDHCTALMAFRIDEGKSGATRLDGRLPINSDGGCLANGEPIGASGLRQVHEVVLQLRGEAGDRQIAGPHRVGFTQVYGAPGVSACTVLSR